MTGAICSFAAGDTFLTVTLYQELCRFAHGRPGHTNADIWESNGPVFVPEGFIQCWRGFRDTFLACTVLLKLAHPGLLRPDDLPKVADYAGVPWHGLAPAAVNAFFRQDDAATGVAG